MQDCNIPKSIFTDKTHMHTFTSSKLLKKIFSLTVASVLAALSSAQTCAVGTAVSSTGFGFVAWGGSSHAQNATGAILAAGSTLTPSNSAVLQESRPLVIDFQRLVSAGSTITVSYAAFIASGSATANIEYSTNGTTWSGAGWATLSTTSTTSVQDNRTVPSGGIRYIRITLNSGASNSMLVDGVQSTHYCPENVRATRAVRSFYNPGTTRGTLATNVYPSNAKTLQFSTVTPPSQGAWTLNSSNGNFTYVPSSTSFDGFDIGVYRVCDGGADNNLATTGDNICDNDTIILRAIFNCDTNVYYMPIPENEAMDFLLDIAAGGGGANGEPLNFYAGLSVTSDAIIVYDHWEDGFETNPRNPTQSTTQIWGDGDMRNGVAPGYSEDILRPGQTMILQNQIRNTGIGSSHPTYDPNGATADNTLQNVTDFDGKDRVLIHGIGAMSKFAWGTALTLSMSGAAVPRTEYWGTSYVLPGGQNSSSAGNNFEVASLSILADENATTVNIDRDANGTVDVTVTLNQGETYYMDNFYNGSASTVNAGGTITANKKVLVMYMTADAATNYQGRTYPLVPNNQLSGCYYLPSVYREDVRAFMYNPNSSAITVTRTGPGGGTTTFTIPAGGTAHDNISAGSDNGFRYCANGSNTFTMIAAVDPGNNTSDWGYVPVSGGNVQQYMVVSLGFGSDPTSAAYPNNNYEQLLVTPVSNTYFYVDLNGDGDPDPFSINDDVDATDASVTIGSTTYNETTSDNGVFVEALRTLSIGSTSGDLSGAVVWTKTTPNNGPIYGANFAAIWGQNGGPPATGNIDVGYTIPPKMFPPLGYNIRVRFPEVCPGSTTDSMHINITGGTAPYRIQWINLQSGVSSVYNFSTDSTKIAGITPGQYIIKVRDAGCLSFERQVTIVEKTLGCTGSIGDRIWLDSDGDGVQDAGEPGLAGISLNLLNSAGHVIGTTISDATGRYSFSNLNPDNYRVQVQLPPNYSFSPQTNTADNANGVATRELGSDVNQTTGQSYLISITSGENENNIDIGLVYNTPTLLGAIGNAVWLDNNNNGVQNSGEPGISGVLVTLYNNIGNPVRATYTNANGEYLFTDLPFGTYSVGFSLPPGMNFSPANQGGNDNIDSDPATSGLNFGRTDPVTINATTPWNTTLDAGMTPAAATRSSIGDKVWNDTDRDGIQDPGEPGIPNVRVDLYDRFLNGTLLATTFTDAMGNYIFNNLVPNDYKIRFNLPSGYAFSPANSGSNDAFDSDADASRGGITAVYPLWGGGSLGYREVTADAGMFNNSVSPSSVAIIGDRVWNDLNRDGVQTIGEIGVPGITVELYNNSGTLVATTFTDFDGLYQFVDVAPGTYRVRFTNIPNGFSLSPKGLGGNTATDSDAEPSTGFTDPFSVVGGNSYLTLDQGLIQGLPAGLGSIGSSVWNDIDQDGLQDLGETGVPNVTVTLRTPGPDGIAGTGDDVTIGTKVTDALGEYMFERLPSGPYFVEFSNLPAGFVRSPQNAGSDDNIDSDVPTTGAARSQIINLAQGEDNLTLDMGLFTTTLFRIGSYVWADVNNNGQQGSPATEPGVPGVMVTLLDGSGNVYDSDPGTAGIQPLVTTTNNEGYFMFNGLPAGSYSALFSNLPPGFSFTTANVGNDATDSDPNTTTGRTSSVTVNAGSPSNMTLGAGLVSTTVAMIGDFVWFDTDGDGIQDSGEPGISGVTVTLFNAAGTTALYSAITDQDGRYLFNNLPAGTYVVGFSTIPENMEFTTQDASSEPLGTDSDPSPATGRTAAITVSGGSVNLGIDAGIRQRQWATVGDLVWIDNDLNGLQNENNGMAGIIVRLFNTGIDGIQSTSDDQLISSAVTNGNGFYQITNVPPGVNYYVTFDNTPPSAWTTQNVGGSNASNNSKSNASGISTVFNITANTVFRNFDAGLINVVPLPVSVLSFEATAHNDVKSKLNWSLSTDEPISSFTVERSFNAMDFTAIGTVTSKPQLNTVLNYEFIDHSPKIPGTNYYRIAIMKDNGQVEYTPVRAVNFHKQGEVKVYPNPAGQMIQIEWPTQWSDQNVHIELFSMTGQLVLQQKGVNATTVLDVGNLKAGVYQLRIISDVGYSGNFNILIQR